MKIFSKDKQGTGAAAPATPAPKHKNPEQVTYDEKQEISKAVEKMDEKQVQNMTEIITQNCAKYRDIEELELDIDDLPNDVQVMLLESVRGIHSDPDKEPDASGGSNPVVIDLTDDDDTQESQGSERPNTSASRSDGATPSSSIAPLPSKWTRAPLPPLRNQPANYEGSSIEFTAGGRPFTALANILPRDHPYKDALVDERKRKVALSEDAATVKCYIDSLYNQKLRLALPGPRLEDFDYLIKLYSFGEKMNDQIFQDYVMEVLRCRLYKPDQGVPRPPFLPDKERILNIFRLTRQYSKLRVMIVNLYIGFSGSGCHTVPTGTAHHEFVIAYVDMITYYSLRPDEYGFMKEALPNAWPWPYFHCIDGLKGV